MAVNKHFQRYGQTLILMMAAVAWQNQASAADSANRDPLKGLLSSKQSVPAPRSPMFEGRGDGVKTCPVTGEKIANANFKAEFYGRTVYFCCRGCLNSAKRDPARFVKASPQEQQKAVQAFLSGARAVDAAEFCND